MGELLPLFALLEPSELFGDGYCSPTFANLKAGNSPPLNDPGTPHLPHFNLSLSTSK
ncbi:MAG: hypothetical protein QOH42_2127 [Blastocatellia bacterium]|nr:hypothetical protein [Blastocatellia bacterium]